MLAAARNVQREPVIPERLQGDEQFLGVPHRVNQTASALLGKARSLYGNSVMQIVWGAIPFLPHDAAPLIEPEKDVVGPIAPEACSYGVHRLYLTFACWLYLDLVEMYDNAEAARFWGNVPFLPPLASFHPPTWAEAYLKRPY